MASNFDSTLASLGINRPTTNQPVTTTRAAQQTLGQGDFLALMTAQMKNQDPFEPVDNTQMVAQMAQFSSLAGITEMSSTMKAIADKLGAGSINDALGWAGRTVLTEGNVAFARASGGIEGGIELGGDATGVTVTIAAADGQVLRTIDLGAQRAGRIDFDWDGMNAAGEAAGDGPFVVRAEASNDTQPVTARTLVWAPVASVSMIDGEAQLSLPGIGRVPASAVRSVG